MAKQIIVEMRHKWGLRFLPVHSDYIEAAEWIEKFLTVQTGYVVSATVEEKEE